MGGIADQSFEVGLDANGVPSVGIAGDPAPDSLDADGGYARQLSGPNGGVQLPAGQYQLELDLRIIATAPVVLGADGRAHRGAVSSATATISVR